MPITRDQFDSGSVLTAEVLAVLKRDPSHAYSPSEIVGALNSPQVTEMNVVTTLTGLIIRGEVQMNLVTTTNGVQAFYAAKR